jgi:hypothetical protein
MDSTLAQTMDTLSGIKPVLAQPLAYSVCLYEPHNDGSSGQSEDQVLQADLAPGEVSDLMCKVQALNFSPLRSPRLSSVD